MNQKRTFSSFPALFVVLAALSACTSVQTKAVETTLPEKSEDVAIFILPVDFEKRDSSRVFGSVRLGITNTATGITVFHSIKSSTTDLTLASFKPGSYKISESAFLYDGGKAWGKRKLDIPFTLEASKITVLRYQFKYITYEKDGEDYMNWEWEGTSQVALERIINRYKNAPNFADWDFSKDTWRLPGMTQAALATGLKTE